MKNKPLGGNRLIFLFAVLYMVSYLTRNNYSTIIAEMVTATGQSKTALSMAVTGSFFSYGLSQLVSGFLGDRVSPKKLLSLGLGVTTAMNLLLPLCPNVALMTVVWCINGAAQAFLWPPMVRVLASRLSVEKYAQSTVMISVGGYVGNLLVYLLAPAIISVLSWKAVFFLCGGCGVVMSVALRSWQIEPVECSASAPGQKSFRFRSFCTPVMVGILAAILIVGILRDGVTTWMPSYIAETYQLGNRISILTGVVLPVFAMVSVYTAGQVYRRWFRSPLACAAVIFGIGGLAALGVVLFSGTHAAVSVLVSALLTGCMHGVNLMLISMLPTFFRKYGCISTASGVLNAAVYVGSAISAYGVAALSDRMGWQTTLWIWLGLAAMGTLLCLVSIRPWRRIHGDA